MYQAPRGEARREAIIRATLALIGERGPDAVTHRAVAERAGVPLSATTYWFSSKEELLREALVLAGREEVEHLERLVLDLAPRDLEPEEWADALAAELASDFDGRAAEHLAFYELVLDAARHPGLREEVVRREEAFLRLAEIGLRAGGSPDPEGDAWIVVGAVSGLMLGQLANPQTDFAEQVLRPTLRRLFTRLKESVPA